MSGLPLLGGIEAGGTKFVLAVGTAPDAIIARHAIPTHDPDTTLAEAAAWFAAQGTVRALGIASFGPVELDPASPRWGHITDTPKPGWSGCDIAGRMGRALGVPVGFDTDVNAAAMAEHAAAGASADHGLAYVTVGTGIGGGLVIGGQPVHGAGHPEMGHMFPRRTAAETGFAGICPAHGDCLEGLASGPAIIARWGASLSDLPAGHEAHAIVAGLVAQLCHSLFALAAVETIVLGGGVMQSPGLVESIATETARLDGGYLPGHARHAIRRPLLGDRSGTVGALMLAAARLA